MVNLWSSLGAPRGHTLWVRKIDAVGVRDDAIENAIRETLRVPHI